MAALGGGLFITSEVPLLCFIYAMKRFNGETSRYDLLACDLAGLPLGGARRVRSPSIPGCCLAIFLPHYALKLIA